MGCICSKPGPGINVQHLEEDLNGINLQLPQESSAFGGGLKGNRAVKFAVINDRYDVQKKTVGTGAFGSVHLAKTRGPDNESVAVKVLEKAADGYDEDLVQTEIQVLRQMGSHENICCLMHCAQDRKWTYIVMEACTGGEVFERLYSSGTFTERDAAKVAEYTLEAIAHCHKMGVVHRDLKPENLLYKNKTPDSPLKLIDFGLAHHLGNPDERMKESVGTDGYMAPEVINRDYSAKCDVWAIGSIVFTLLCGDYAFMHENPDVLDGMVLELLGNNGDSLLRNMFTDNKDTAQVWSKVSPAAKEFVCRLMAPEPTRPSAAEALKDPWIISGGPADAAQLSTLLPDRWRRHRMKNKLVKEATVAIASKMSAQEIDALTIEFNKVDTDQSNSISLLEFKQVMSHLGMLDAELESVFESLDLDNSGSINKTEFVAGTMSAHSTLTKQKLEEVFYEFDIDKSGQMDLAELEKVLRGDKVLAQDVFTKMDVNMDGVVDLEEFTAYLEANA